MPKNKTLKRGGGVGFSKGTKIGITNNKASSKKVYNDETWNIMRNEILKKRSKISKRENRYMKKKSTRKYKPSTQKRKNSKYRYSKGLPIFNRSENNSQVEEYTLPYYGNLLRNNKHRIIPTGYNNNNERSFINNMGYNNNNNYGIN